jgi:hypothetical protein
MKLHRILLIFCLLCASPLTWAKVEKQECDRNLIAQTLGEKLNIALKDKPQFSHYEWRELTLVCKNKPNNLNHVIVAAFYESLLPRKANEEDNYMFAVAVIDKKKHRIVSQHTQKYETDATTRIDEYSLKIDTGQYDLAENARSIGVRVNTFFSRCTYEGGWGEELWLFVDKNPVLQPVLQGLSMERYSYQTLQGSLCGGPDELISVNHTAKLNIDLSERWNKGYRDLNIHANLSSETENLDATLKDQRKFIGRLKFDGKQYQHGFLHGVISNQFEKRERIYKSNYKRTQEKK